MWDIRTVYLYNTDVLVSHPYEGGTLYLYSTDELVSHPYDIERSLISYGWDIRSSVWDKNCTDEFQISTESVPHRCVTNSSVWHDFNIDGSVQHCSSSNALAILHWAIDIISHGRIAMNIILLITRRWKHTFALYIATPRNSRHNVTKYQVFNKTTAQYDPYNFKLPIQSTWWSLVI